MQFRVITQKNYVYYILLFISMIHTYMHTRGVIVSIMQKKKNLTLKVSDAYGDWYCVYYTWNLPFVKVQCNCLKCMPGMNVVFCANLQKL